MQIFLRRDSTDAYFIDMRGRLTINSDAIMLRTSVFLIRIWKPRVGSEV